MQLSPIYSCMFILVLGGMQSAFFVVKRPWSDRIAKSTAFDTNSVSSSPLVPASTLALWRLMCFAWIAFLGGNQFVRVGFWVMGYYTIWNWWLLAAYFLISGVLALRKHISGNRAGNKDSPRQGSSLVAYTATAMFHVNITTVALVDSVTWLVLVPMLMRNPDPTHIAYTSKMLFNFTSYNQHGVNALMILVDLVLNAIPFCPYMVGYAGLWSLMYSVWAMIWHSISGRWLYPFLDTSKPNAPVSYLCLYLAHFIFYGSAYVLILAKQKILARCRPIKTRVE